MFSNPVLLIIAAAFVGGLLLAKPLKNINNFIYNKHHFIRNYWILSVIFVLIAVLSYILVFRYAPPERLDTYLQILSTALTLLFAIFVGYFAFAAVVDNRFYKFKEIAAQYIDNNEYPRAIEQYEEAFKIKKNDPTLLMNLTESYLITKNDPKFLLFIPILEKEVISDREKLVCYFLKAARELLVTQNLANAKLIIEDSIKYIKENKNALPSFWWGFSDIKHEGYYTELRADDEAKIIFDNYVKYLSKNLSDEHKSMFESGNYKIVEPTPLPATEVTDQEPDTQT